MQFTVPFVMAAMAFLDVAVASNKFIQYSGVGYSGSYKDVTKMDESSGKCSSSTKSFSGNLSPLDEDLSVHIRGPINLKKFAVYTQSSSNSKRDLSENVDCEDKVNLKRHLHHQHKREAATQVVDVTQTVYVTEGDDETTTASPSTTTSASVVNNINNKVLDKYHSTDVEPSSSAITSASSYASSSSSYASSSDSASKTSSSSSSPSATGSGSWSRDSYYDASEGTSDNVVFMNHKGDESYSGTWSSSFGNSISYADSKGTGKSKSATTLSDTTLDSDDEVILFSGKDCDDDCGYYRDGIPAKKGWDGKLKIFAFKFKMPKATDSVTNNHDMPAIWLLNGRIPRTLQYGEESCSCWSTGCGELDLFEVDSESDASSLTNHLHDGQGGHNLSRWGGGGSSETFDRPYNDYLTAVVIFDGSNISLIQVDDFDFDSSLSASTVSKWLSGSATKANVYGS